MRKLEMNEIKSKSEIFSFKTDRYGGNILPPSMKQHINDSVPKVLNSVDIIVINIPQTTGC